jgi:shikimate dehydrogenase
MAGSERDHVLIGLIGEGIGQSLSPLLHQREADRQGIRLIYTIIDSEPLSLTAADLPEVLRWAQTLGYRGLNVTYPFKQNVVKHLDVLSDEARSLGAVNTVVFENGRSNGYNTDWSDSVADSSEASWTRRGIESCNWVPVVPGPAVAHAMLSMGTGHLTLVDLDTEKAKHLAELLAKEFGPERIAVGLHSNLSEILARAQGVINTTPVGMVHHPGSPIPDADLRRDLWVADVVYRPTETRLLRAARAVDARTLDGGGMSAFQAIAAFEYFTGATANVEAMLADSAELLTSDV